MKLFDKINSSSKRVLLGKFGESRIVAFGPTPENNPENRPVWVWLETKRVNSSFKKVWVTEKVHGFRRYGALRPVEEQFIALSDSSFDKSDWPKFSNFELDFIISKLEEEIDE